MPFGPDELVTGDFGEGGVQKAKEFDEEEEIS